MLNLQYGIGLYDSSPSNSVGDTRVMLSNGTKPVSSSSLEYCSNAFIPLEPWRKPTADELELLRTNQIPKDFSTGISIIVFPDNILSGFDDLDLAAILKRHSISGRGDLPVEVSAAAEKMLIYLEPFCISEGKLFISGIAQNPMGLKTLTRDSSRNFCYTGLHIDNWDGMPILHRDKSTNRISINLGSEDRFFLYINLPLLNIIEMLGKTRGSYGTVNSSPTSIGKEFMKEFPEYPVIKLRIAPKEAYLAPTENIIHDASTLDKLQTDINLHIRGGKVKFPH